MQKINRRQQLQKQLEQTCVATEVYEDACEDLETLISIESDLDILPLYHEVTEKMESLLVKIRASIDSLLQRKSFSSLQRMLSNSCRHLELWLEAHQLTWNVWPTAEKTTCCSIPGIYLKMMAQCCISKSSTSTFLHDSSPFNRAGSQINSV